MFRRGWTWLAFLTIGAALPARADFSSCATDWANFTGPNGFVREYTSQGALIRDHETSSDPTNGGTGVSPTEIDLASGSPGGFPGPYSTVSFGYYDGGTLWNPNDPPTLEDDHIFFRWRLAASPVTGKNDFISRHYNVLLDLDADGYKEYWVDMNGSYQSSGSTDQLQLLYDNANRQNVPSADAARVNEFSASALPLTAAGCTAGGSPGLSHTRVRAAADGTGDFFLEVQVPVTAFDDLSGNQVLYPDSPVAFTYTTSASATDPLQKDFMNDLHFLSNADPISFGDVVTPSGLPRISFTDAALSPVDTYALGANVYIYLNDPRADADPSLPECVDVTVTDPATGDDEVVRLCETGPHTGIFTNRGGLCDAAITFPASAPAPPSAWLEGATTSNATLTENWTLVYSSATNTWSVAGSVSGAQAAVQASTCVPPPSCPVYSTTTGGLSFILRQNSPTNGTTLQFCSRAADPLVASSASGGDDDATLQADSGDTIHVAYTSVQGVTVTDAALILGPCDALIAFTRVNGLIASNYRLNLDPGLSDRIYVTVTHAGANTNPATVQTITIVLTGNDTQTATLAETGPDTGVFRNAGGLQTKISDGTVVPEDGLWEDVDTGSITAAYAYLCGGSPYVKTTTASLFVVSGGGRVAFTNGAGTLDVELYTTGQPVFVKATDASACTTPLGGVATLGAVVTSPSGDAQTLTLFETAPGSGVFMNERYDLATGAGSAVVTSASSTFVSDGILPGARFAIASGPDAGLYTVSSVDSQTQITLTAPLSSTRTAIAFASPPLLTGTYDGAAAAGDFLIEATHGDTLTVSYDDCNDGDADPGNDVKTDTALYNAPFLLINRVLFAPDATTCQTELVEVYNAAGTPVVATGYRIRDEDAQLDYTVPQLAGFDITLQPGQKLVLSIGGDFNDFFGTLSNTYYVFTPSATYPSNVLGGPGDADAGDQVLLFDPSDVVADYVGWSATTSLTLDFLGDDSPAVLRSIWQDDAYRNVSAMTVGQVLRRGADGFDTNAPADWVLGPDSTCQTIIDDNVVTRAVLGGLRVDAAAGVVEFVTLSQRGTLGFRLYEGDDAGGRDARPLSDRTVAVRARDASVPQLYRVETRPVVARFVFVEELEAGGRVRRMGPFAWGDARLERGLRRIEARLREAPKARLARAALDARRVGPRPALAPGPGVKIRTRGAGRVAVALSELQALGLTSPKALRLTNLGRDVPFEWRSASAGQTTLVFRAEALSTDYTGDNVYVASWGRGVPEKPVPLTRSADAPQPGFTRVEKTTVYWQWAPRESDPWLWDLLVAGGGTWPYDWWDPTAGTFDLPGLLPKTDGEASVRLRLVGASEHAHKVQARLNGELIGDVAFQGETPALLEGRVSVSALRAADNRLTLEYASDAPDWEGFVYLDYLDLAAPLSTVGRAQVVALEPWNPLPESRRAADYLVVTHADFLDAARGLAALKAGEGWRPAVVDVARAYDAYSGGVVEARAVQALIRAFAQDGVRHVLLMGDDTLDPRDYLGSGAATYVPSLVAWDDDAGRVPSENAYADLDGDGRPELAIGRLPAQTAAQAAALVGKVGRQSGVLAKLHGRHLFVADNEMPGDVKFLHDAGAVAAALPAGSSVAWADLGQGLQAARTALFGGWREGAMLTHYFGHGGPEVWADEHLLALSDVPALSPSAPTVLLSWTCQTQWYQNLWGPALNEALLLLPDGGSLASFGPAGVSQPETQRALYEPLYRELSGKRSTLGEAIRRAKRRAVDAGSDGRAAAEIFNLLGDPALRLPR